MVTPCPVGCASEPITIGPGQQASVRLYAKIGQLKSDVVARVQTDDGTVASRRFNAAEHEALAGIMPSGEGLIVTLGGALVAADRAYLEQRKIHVASLDHVGQLPSDWWGFEGVDAVILATGDDETSAQWSTASPQIAALDEWVRMGGRLVVSVGRHAEGVLASGAPLAAMVPGVCEGMVPLRQSAILESYAETTDPLHTGGGAFELQVAKLAGARGKIEAYAGREPRDLPIVVRASRGFGEIVFVAADLDRPPLSTWTARTQFIEKLLRTAKAPAADESQGTLGQVTTLGFVDMAGQLRGALDQFAGVELVPFWVVVVLVLAYIGCIGPLDYWLVKHVFRRAELTWLTFAVTVLVFSGTPTRWPMGSRGASCASIRSTCSISTPKRARCAARVGPTCLVPRARRTTCRLRRLPSTALPRNHLPRRRACFSRGWGCPGAVLAA